MESRPEAGTETEPEEKESSEPNESPENQKPAIDDDISGSVNAALPDADD
jgi:hypothetical protein